MHPCVINGKDNATASLEMSRRIYTQFALKLGSLCLARSLHRRAVGVRIFDRVWLDSWCVARLYLSQSEAWNLRCPESACVFVSKGVG